MNVGFPWQRRVYFCKLDLGPSFYMLKKNITSAVIAPHTSKINENNDCILSLGPPFQRKCQPQGAIKMCGRKAQVLDLGLPFIHTIVKVAEKNILSRDLGPSFTHMIDHVVSSNFPCVTLFGQNSGLRPLFNQVFNCNHNINISKTQKP